MRGIIVYVICILQNSLSSEGDDSLCIFQNSLSSEGDDSLCIFQNSLSSEGDDSLCIFQNSLSSEGDDSMDDKLLDDALEESFSKLEEKTKPVFRSKNKHILIFTIL